MTDNSNNEILTERDVCNWLGISEPTLFRHRRDGTGPKFIRLSERRVGYRRNAVEEWLSRRERQSLSHSETRSQDRDAARLERTGAHRFRLLPQSKRTPVGLPPEAGARTQERNMTVPIVTDLVTSTVTAPEARTSAFVDTTIM